MPSSATSPPTIYSLSLHDALPISPSRVRLARDCRRTRRAVCLSRGSRMALRHRSAARRLGRRGSGRARVPKCRVVFVAAALRYTSRSEEHTSELQSLRHLVCRLLLRRPPPSTPCPYTTLFRSHLREFVWLAIAVGLAAPFASRAVRGWRFVTDPRRAAWAAAAVAALVYLSAASSLWPRHLGTRADRKSTRLNSSHLGISYAVFCYVAPHHLLLVPTRRSSDLTFASSSGSRLPSDSPRRLPLARFADGASSPIRGAPPGPPRQWPRSCT